MSDDTATISYIPLQEGTLGPILTTLSQNIPNNPENLNFSLLQKRSNYALSAQLTSNLDLVGKQLKSAENSTYVLGFYNPEKRTIRFVPTTATMNIKTIVKREATANKSKFQDNDAQGLERKALIVEEIGTKKSQKILKQLKNKIISESKIQSANDIKQIIKLQSGVYKEEMETQNTEEFQKEWNRKRTFLPDFNLSARSAGKIYNVKSIISEEDYAELYISELYKPGIAIPYVRNIMEQLGFNNSAEKEIEDKEDEGKKSTDAKKKQLLYLNYLIKMKKLKKVAKDLTEISESMKMPLHLIQGILDKFYEMLKHSEGEGAGNGVKYSKTKVLDIKMTCYIFILNLIITDFKVNLKPLMSLLKMDEQRAVLIATEVGCTITRTGEDIFAKLNKLKVTDSNNKTK